MKRALRMLCAAAALLALSACGKKAPVIKSFTASNASVLAGGGTWLLFETADAEKLTIDPGAVDVTGKTSAPIAPSATTTYTLTATNSGGSVTATTSVTVMPLAATLTALSATPDGVKSGEAVTLQWEAQSATAQTLVADPPSSETLPPLSVSQRHVVVHPTVPTLYTLTVHGADGTTQPAPRSVSVAVASTPVVVLTADATQAVRGGQVALHWTRSVAISFTLLARPAGATGPVTRLALGTEDSVQVQPLADTDYSIEALGPGGISNSNVVTIAVTGALAAALSYTVPTPGTGDAVALQLRSGGDGVTATFDLITLKDLTAGGLALELPLDGAAAGSRTGAARVKLDSVVAGDVTPGFTVNTAALDPGTAPPAAIAALPGTGPSRGVLLIGLTQKPTCTHGTCAGGVDGDRVLPAGTLLATVRLRLVPEAGAGPVFGATALDAAHGFRSVVALGSGAAVGTIAVGALAAQ